MNSRPKASEDWSLKCQNRSIISDFVNDLWLSSCPAFYLLMDPHFNWPTGNTCKVLRQELGSLFTLTEM